MEMIKQFILLFILPIFFGGIFISKTALKSIIFQDISNSNKILLPIFGIVLLSFFNYDIDIFAQESDDEMERTTIDDDKEQLVKNSNEQENTNSQEIPENFEILIFDLKAQEGVNLSGVQINSINKFINGHQPITLSALVYTPTKLNSAKIQIGTNEDGMEGFSDFSMSVEKLPGIENVFRVTGIITANYLQPPAIYFWISVENESGNKKDSPKNLLGINPNRPILAKLELDSPSIIDQGGEFNPIAYVYNNGDTPIFGSISLLIDNLVVKTTPVRLFDLGETEIVLEWQVPKNVEAKNYQVSSRLNLFVDIVNTGSTSLSTFPSTQTVPISQPALPKIVQDDGGNEIAHVSILYSSHTDNPEYNYKVIAPDNTCVIGPYHWCLVTDSTKNYRENTQSVTIDNQIFRIRYSGGDSPLERFVISSIDPILGVWQVDLQSNDGVIQSPGLANDVFVKLKYTSQKSFLTTVSSENNE